MSEQGRKSANSNTCLMKEVEKDIIEAASVSDSEATKRKGDVITIDSDEDVIGNDSNIVEEIKKQTLENALLNVKKKRKKISVGFIDLTRNTKVEVCASKTNGNSKSKPHTCPYPNCSYSASTLQHLKNHVNGRHTRKNIHYCQQCKYSTPRVGDLKHHIKTVHLKNELFSCEFCSHKSTTKTNLKNHINSIHTKEQEFKCTYCDYIAFRKNDLVCHLNSKHEKNKFYECPYCDYKSTLSGTLHKHINSNHTRKKEYPCDICSYRATQKSHLDKHILNKHKNPKKKQRRRLDNDTVIKEEISIEEIKVEETEEKPNNLNTHELMEDLDNAIHGHFEKVIVKTETNEPIS